jgi:hypothetical protein
MKTRQLLSPANVLLLLAMVHSGCSDDTGHSHELDDASSADAGAGEVLDDVAADVGEGTGAVTWYQHIAPIVVANCGSCHREGGSGPLDFTQPEAAQSAAGLMLAAIESGSMPPWPPADNCRTYEHERRLPPTDAELFARWVSNGAPLGDAATAAELPEIETAVFPANLILPMPEAYTPSRDLPDDWRCFVLDGEFEEETFVRGVDVLPGSAQVHHVLVYAVTAQAAEAILEADSAEVGPGYTCFGGPNPSSGGGESDGSILAGGFPNQLGAWVPGNVAAIYDEGTALRIDAGSRVIMQVHYNTLAGEPVADRSELQLLTTTEAPEFLVRTVPIADRNLAIAAGDSASTHGVTIPNFGDRSVEIITVAAHMHTLGEQLRARIVRADGSDECLLDIPAWDFNWQMFYRLPADDHAIVEPGDAIELTCVFDNSAANQPIVNGEQIEPRDVEWGESTLDEMCLFYISTIEPYVPPAETNGEVLACGSVQDCATACDPLNTECLFDSGCGNLRWRRVYRTVAGRARVSDCMCSRVGVAWWPARRVFFGDVSGAVGDGRRVPRPGSVFGRV